MFVATYSILAFIVFVEAWLLRRLVKETVWFKKFYADFSYSPISPSLSPGELIPSFALPRLSGGEKVFLTSELLGESSALVFVFPDKIAPSLYQSVRGAVHALWHKMFHRVYVVCQGTSLKCRTFIEEHLTSFPETQVLLDEHGLVAGSLQISESAQAVELDEETRNYRYGIPEPLREAHRYQAFTGAENLLKNVTELSDNAITATAFDRVDSSVSCVLTRFRLRSPLFLLPFYVEFLRIRRDARRIDGLIHALFLVENARTCYTLSFWKDDRSIVEFGKLYSHVRAGNLALHRTYDKDSKRPEIWSGQFRLWALSAHNINWKD